MPIKAHRVTPFLWFDGQAEEAARFYVSVFKKGSIGLRNGLSLSLFPKTCSTRPTKSCACES